MLQDADRKQNFSTRSANGEEFSRKIFDDIARWGFAVAMNGTEHTHPTFITNLRQSNDQTSLTIRYQPDGVICAGRPARSAYVEAKKSKFIERQAYENYMRLASDGALVVVVFGIYLYGYIELSNSINFCDVRVLRFLPPVHDRWPVVDGWISPREHPNWERERATFKGSGTPYKEIDQKSLIPWLTFPAYIRKAFGIT